MSADGTPFRSRESGLAQKYANHGKITTLMLRNVPTVYTQDMLLDEIIECIRSDACFDFFYLPWDLQNNCNVGYAFINFADVASAERCTRLFTNFSWKRFNSHRSVAKVFPAHIQGLENNIRHLMDRAVAEAHTHYPIIMWKGKKLKLGKVIAALDSKRSRPPMSAPGQLPSAGGLVRVGPRNEAAGRMFDASQPYSADYQAEHRSLDQLPPMRMQFDGYKDLANGLPFSKEPSGACEHLNDWTPEQDILEAMPGFRAALQRKYHPVHYGSVGAARSEDLPAMPAGLWQDAATAQLLAQQSLLLGGYHAPASNPGRTPGRGNCRDANPMLAAMEAYADRGFALGSSEELARLQEWAAGAQTLGGMNLAGMNLGEHLAGMHLGEMPMADLGFFAEAGPVSGGVGVARQAPLSASGARHLPPGLVVSPPLPTALMMPAMAATSPVEAHADVAPANDDARIINARNPDEDVMRRFFAKFG